MKQDSLPARLRVLRAERGLTLEEAAKKTGVTRETLGFLERGRRHPHTPTLAKIAAGYGISVEELVGEPIAPLDEVPERGSLSLTRQLEDWRVRLLDAAAERWSREVENGGMFESVDLATGYSSAVNTEAAQLFEIIEDRLIPAIKRLPKSIAENEMQKLVATRGKLEQAAAAVNQAAEKALLAFGASVPPEPSDEERRSAELSEEARRNKEQVREQVETFRNRTKLLEAYLREESRWRYLETGTVKRLAASADSLAQFGVSEYMRLNPDARDSAEVGLAEHEDALAKLVAATVRLVEAQEAREEDEGKRGELIQMRQRVASRQVA